MKKSMLAVAVLGAFAGSAFAADVTIYGIVDTGLVYSHNEVDGHATTAEEWNDVAGLNADGKTDTFSMNSGVNSGSRVGLRGTEDLGNGLTVGFKLENGFKTDSGKLGTDGTLFDREATISLSGSFGSLYAGRMSTLVSDTGSVGFYGSMASSFGSGWSDNITGHTAVMAEFATRYDNTLAYVSPEFAGLTVYAQYAMGENGNENKPGTDRYAAIGAEYKAGSVDLGILVDWLNKDTTKEGVWKKHDPNIKDAYTVNLAGSYDCGFAKTYLAVQYFKNARDAGAVLDTIGFFDADFYMRDTEEKKQRAANFSKAAFANDGYGVHLSTSFNALGGTWKAGVGYMDADVNYASEGEVGSVNAYTASVGYEYSLSKRTVVYAGAGYLKREADINSFDGSTENKGSWEQESYDVALGLLHKF